MAKGFSSPKKLLQTKWTAVAPRQKERHFLVTKIVQPDAQDGAVTLIEIEAVYSKRVRIIPWQDLLDTAVWTRGWVLSNSPTDM